MPILPTATKVVLRSFALGWILLLLGLQNFLIYFQHYLGNASFPSDFPQTYFAVPYFWTTAAKARIFPQWVAQQAMGYPLSYNLQSGLFYPLFWLFPLFNVAYTLHWAVIIQCLTVFSGAVGFYFCARSFKLAAQFAFGAAFAYQLSGGFFGNAEHADIIRAYAFIPWLIYAFQMAFDSPNRLGIREVVLLPLSVFLLFVAGYPGASIAALWMGLTFTVLTVIFSNLDFRQNCILLLRASLLTGLGLVLSLVHLLPSFMMKHEIARNQDINITAVSWMRFKHLFTLFLSPFCPNLSEDPSMRSFYIGLPCVALLFLFKLSIDRSVKVLLGMLAMGITMASENPISLVLRHILSPLGYSRFPISDYKAWILIPLIILSFKNFEKYDLRNPLISWCGFATFLGVGLSLLSVPSALTALFWQTIMLFIGLGGFFIFIIRCQVSPTKALPVFLTLLMANAIFVHNSSSALWRAPSVPAVDASSNRFAFDGTVDTLRTALIKVRNVRPARGTQPGAPSWWGYLTGSYEINDYAGGMQLARPKFANSEPELLDFLRRSSETLLIKPIDYTPNLSLPELKAAAEKVNPTESLGSVEMLRLNQNGALFKVELAHPAVMVENELYFPGWSAFQTDLNSKTQIYQTASESASALRTWNLPQGRYTFETYFETPYLKLAGALSFLGLLIWIIVFAYTVLRPKVRTSQPS